MRHHHIRKSISRAALAAFALAALALLGAGPGVRTAQAAAGAPPLTVNFDHMATGFELDGAHRDLPCEACHLNAVFKGTPRACGICHVAGSKYNATPKNKTHILSTNDCAACHTTSSFRTVVHFDHAQVLGSCASCHNGVIAQGEGPNHPATSQSCDACHTVMSWNPPKSVDHSQIPLAVAGFCIICHNGVQATGKNSTHLQTTLECGDCHLTSTWLGATFDHTGILTGCASCHDGVKAVGKQGAHMPTSNLCENCHTTGIGTKSPSWAPSLFDHTQMAVSTCQTCHSGTVKISTGYVQGQPSNHVPPIPSSIDCGVCHGNNPTAETWDVISASIATLHSGLSTGNCLMCHAGQTFAGKPAPYVPMTIAGISPLKTTPLAPPHIPVISGSDCSACHGAAFQAGGFGPATAMSAAKHAFVSTTCDTCHDTGKSFYTGSGTPLQLRPADHVNNGDAAMVSGDCSQCHTTTDWSSKVLPPGHMPNPANQACSACHTNAPNDYTTATLAALPVLHTGITGNCGQCHGATVSPLTWAVNYTPKDAILTPSHIPYLSGTDCGSCHTKNYVTGGFGPMNMTQATHAFVPTSCNTCHEAGLSFYMGAASPALQGRPTDHTGTMAAPADCSQCHTTANWNSTAMPAGHMPNPGNQACSVCHTAIGSTLASYATLASISVLHTGISGNCGQCHGSPTAGQLSFYNNNDNPKAAVLTPAHIPYSAGTDCSSCHTANYTTGGFGPMNMTQATHAFVPTTCNTCHEAGLSFYMGAASPALQGRPADHTGSLAAPADCSGCHTTANWNSTALPAGHMPNPGNQACNVCHTSAPSNYKVFASIAVLHTGITGGCAQCHGGATQLSFYNNDMVIKAAVLTPAHIPAFAGEDCSACHAPNFVAGGFGPMNMTQATHAGVGTTCNTCHEAGLSFYMGAASPGLQGRPTDHTGSLAAPADCSGCHTTANWNSTALPAGHMPNPGNQACSVCHTAAPTNYTTLAANSVLHTGITGGCGQCHGAPSGALTWYNNFTPKDAVLSPSHIPYLSGTDCGSCHKSTTYAVGTFGPMNMTQATHAFVPTTCNTCHEAGLSFYMGAASPALQGRPSDHTGSMAAPADCSLCHTTANWNSTSLPANHMPNPASQACSVCHTAAPTNYTTLAANPVLHTGITSGCITCHAAPNATPPVYAVNFTPKDAVLSPVHIPTGATPCEDCHSPTTFTSFSGTTMSPSKHTAMFGYIGNTCDACHNRVTPPLTFYGVNNLTTRPTGDPHNSGNGLTQDCSQCHNTNDWGGNAAQRAATSTTNRSKILVVVNPSSGAHAAAVLGGGLAGSAALAPGQIPRHITTPRVGAPGSGSSPVRMTTLGVAAGAIPSHAGVTANCASCHNGVLASGKPPGHVQSNSSCENCHTTIAWLPATFDHRGVIGACSTCHNGVTAPGKPPLHVPTALECGACHGTIAWKPARYDHTGLAASCQTCHNGLSAVGKPLQHPVTTQDCASCHNTFSWQVAPAIAPKLPALIRGGHSATQRPNR
ncbi:MAG: hypothetical protein KGL34_13135 [Gammaproteobacteria bacterium]|nr:hypothetical protein [Gammaproteobacteria bacterium]